MPCLETYGHQESASQILEGSVPLGMAQSILPNLRYFWFRGKVTISECKICINAPNLSKATIMLEKDWDRYTTSSFQASSCIRKFLANFRCCEKLQTVYVTDPEAPIFPDSMREELSPPLPSLKHLKVLSKCSPKLVKDYGLTDYLRWMAPSLEFFS
ncbi:hypothetical protein ACFX2C_036753 [Malus domestica]